MTLAIWPPSSGGWPVLIERLLVRDRLIMSLVPGIFVYFWLFTGASEGPRRLERPLSWSDQDERHSWAPDVSGAFVHLERGLPGRRAKGSSAESCIAAGS